MATNNPTRKSRRSAVRSGGVHERARELRETLTDQTCGIDGRLRADGRWLCVADRPTLKCFDGYGEQVVVESTSVVGSWSVFRDQPDGTTKEIVAGVDRQVAFERARREMSRRALGTSPAR